MVPGEAGRNQMKEMESVPRAVVEELRPGGDSVTVQPRPTVVKTVMVITLSREGATLTPALSEVMYKNGFALMYSRMCMEVTLLS